MIDFKTKFNRNYGYDILINNFEPFLRRYLCDKVFLINYANDWRKYIPQGVINDLHENKDIQDIDNMSIMDFFEELNFLNLKDIIIAFNNYRLSKSFLGELSKDKFIEIMDKLNIYRKKIAHAKSCFSNLDLLKLIDLIELLCQGEAAREILIYLENEQYKNAKDVPLDFYEEYDYQHNLPPESYDLDGGFVGREEEIKAIIKLLTSDQDRIITITGAGGVGKTAIALKLSYLFLSDPQNPFEAIIWFSAKTSKLTDEGIIPLDPDIKSNEQLIIDLLNIVDPEILEKFKNAQVPFPSYKTQLYNIFSSQKCLIIIDNLETILKDDALISFIKDIPRPSQVLITSRKGMGEIERRYPIGDMPNKDAIQLFRIIAKERNRIDLLRLSPEKIGSLVKRVKCYPLLIKWSIGQVCLGKDIEEAFSQIFAGESEIAKFSFNDVFNLLSDNSKNILYSMIIYGEKPCSRFILMHLSNLNDEQFEEAIKELILTSFVFPEIKEVESKIVTEYSMLTLTRGFVESKFDADIKTKEMLLTRNYHLSEQIKELEKAKTSYSQSLFSLGIKTIEERVAFDYVKAAKIFSKQGYLEEAEKNFEEALKIAPDFSYALMEYSKYEFSRKRSENSLRLAKRAIEVKSNSYHTWFNLGSLQRRLDMIPEAIESLKKAKELNPKHLPIYNELGRSYTYWGDYEKANEEFNKALKEEKYPNYRHKLLTYQFLADNYKRWAEAFSLRYDKTGQIQMLENGIENAKKALEINAKDKIVWRIYWDIHKDLGIAIWREKGSEKGRPILEECLGKMEYGKFYFNPDQEMMAEACYMLATLSFREKGINPGQVDLYVNKGLSNCLTGSRWLERLNEFKKMIDKGEILGRIRESLHGKIKLINYNRRFGIIETSEDTFLFFFNGFRNHLSPGTIKNLGGKSVSFILIENPGGKDRYVASDIEVKN